jgi:hypothetical protein
MKFWNKVAKSESCWFWTGCKNKDGYGKIKVEGSTKQAHRVSYNLHVGEIPTGVLVLHRCDVPSCVNPDHLFLGTHQDNADDREAKGRSVAGARPRDLPTAVVIGIRQLFKEGIRQADISRKYGVTNVVVHNIVRGKTYQEKTE